MISIAKKLVSKNFLLSKLIPGVAVIIFPGCSSFDLSVEKEHSKIHNLALQQNCPKIFEKSQTLDHNQNTDISKNYKNIIYSKSINANTKNINSITHNDSLMQMDLEHLISIALKNDPSTRISYNQFQIALDRKKQADSAFFPTVSVGVTAAKNKSMGGVDPENPKKLTTTTSTSIFPSVNIYYSIFKCGAHKEGSLAALSHIGAQSATYSHAIQALTHNVMAAYYDLSSACAIVKANEKNVYDAQVILEAAKKRHESGLTNKQDVLKAETTHSSAIYELENSRALVESARAQLARVVGQPDVGNLNVDVIDLDDLSSNDNNIYSVDENLQNLENLLSSALKDRQDMRALEYSVAAAKHNSKSKCADQLPEVFVQGEFSSKKIKHFNGHYSNYQIAAGISWNIFDGFYKSSAQHIAKKEQKIAEEQLRAKIIAINAEVWESFYALKSSAKKIDAAKKSEKFATESLDSTQKSYVGGLCSLTDLLMAQNALSVARKQKVLAYNDSMKSMTRLMFVTGQFLNSEE